MRRLIAAFVIAGALALTRGSAAEEPFEILTYEPLTGPAAFVGANTAKAIAAAQDLVNRTGGIKGRQVRFVVSDDQSNPQVAVQIVSGYLTKKPSIIIGGILASLCNAPAGLLKADGPVLWCFSPGVHPPAGSWIYSTGFSTDDMFHAGLTYFRGGNLTKVATLTSTDATGQDADHGIADELAKGQSVLEYGAGFRGPALGGQGLAQQVAGLGGAPAELALRSQGKPARLAG